MFPFILPLIEAAHRYFQDQPTCGGRSTTPTTHQEEPTLFDEALDTFEDGLNWLRNLGSSVQSGVRRLIVAGGEASGAVVDRLRIPGFLVGAEIAAGVPVLRAVGAGNGEMLLALKSGNFGGPEFFSDALKLMR